jgi:hypothetical protein
MDNVIKIGAGRYLVTTPCHECFIDIEGTGHEDPRYRDVAISLLSGHAGNAAGRLRQRIPQAWKVLTGKGGRPFLELLTRDEVDGLVGALTMARKEAFGD